MVSSRRRIVSSPPLDETVLQKRQLFQSNAPIERDFSEGFQRRRRNPKSRPAGHERHGFIGPVVQRPMATTIIGAGTGIGDPQ
jgi:hypothetical protein